MFNSPMNTLYTDKPKANVTPIAMTFEEDTDVDVDAFLIL